MTDDKCPKCGAELRPGHDMRIPVRVWICESVSHDGVFHQSFACRIRELEAENARLREQIEDHIADAGKKVGDQ